MSREPEATAPKRTFALRRYIAMLSQRAARNEDGVTAIEYALIASGIGAAVAATVWTVNVVLF